MLRDNKILMLYDAVIVTLFVVLPYVTKIHEPPPPKQKINCKKQFMIGLQGYLEICVGDL